MTHEEIRAQLLRTAAFHSLGYFDAVARYADEAARTLAQALVGEQDERDFVIGLLGDWTHEHGAALCPRGADTYGEGMRDAKQQVARILARLGEAVPSAERDAAVRALLEAISEIDDEGEPSYGYYLGGDPRDFSPDEECCSPEEISAHAEACRAWDRGECPDLGGPHQPLTAEDCVAYEMALGVAREHPPEFAGYKTVGHYGIGTTMLRDPRTVTLKALAAAVRKHYPEGK